MTKKRRKKVYIDTRQRASTGVNILKIDERVYRNILAPLDSSRDEDERYIKMALIIREMKTVLTSIDNS